VQYDLIHKFFHELLALESQPITNIYISARQNDYKKLSNEETEQIKFYNEEAHERHVEEYEGKIKLAKNERYIRPSSLIEEFIEGEWKFEAGNTALHGKFILLLLLILG
jgi:hypothetical protein